MEASSKPPNSSNLEEPNSDQNKVNDDRRRMQNLRHAMDKTVKSFISQLRLIRPISGTSPAVLKQMHEETKKQLEENIRTELEMMYEEENVVNLLNGLDRLIETNTQSEESKSWRPSGNVETDIRAHVATLKNQQLQVLEKTLNDLEAQNKLLQEQEKKREKHLLHTRDKISKVVASMEETVQFERSTVEELVSNLQQLKEMKDN